MSELENFKAALEAKSVEEVREFVIYEVMMANMLPREDATYLVDEMVAGDMPTGDFNEKAQAAIERIARR